MAVGASGYWAALDHLDGLDLLYAGSDRLDMTGKLVDIRLGLLKEWADTRSVELLILHGRSDMSHDFRMPIQAWDPNTRRFTTVTRDEHNDDRTRVWGAHTEMAIPIDRHGSRVGWLVTANRLSHPKIPNFPLANLPRDPGTTYAFNIGVGAARSLGVTSSGLDIVYEPIWSHTWADAATDVTTEDGAVIPAGGKLFENWFRFSNIRVRAGVAHEFRNDIDSTVSVRVQLGLAVSANGYRLRQRDNVQLAERAQVTRWTEWGPTLGVAVRAHLVEIGYTLQVNCSPEGLQPGHRRRCHCFGAATGHRRHHRVTERPGRLPVRANPHAPLLHLTSAPLTWRVRGRLGIVRPVVPALALPLSVFYPVP